MYFFNRKFILEYIKECPKFLAFLTPKERADKNLVLNAIKFDGDCFAFADVSLKNDYEFTQKCVVENVSAVNYVNSNLTKDIVWCKQVVKLCPSSFHILASLNTNITKNTEICQFALADISNFSYIYQSVTDKNQLAELAKQNKQFQIFVNSLD